MPYLQAPYNVSQESFDMIFGSAKLMYIASISAYLIGSTIDILSIVLTSHSYCVLFTSWPGSLSDIWLFGVIKKATKGKFLWLRATGSTVISQVLDSFVVSYVAFSLGKTLTGQSAATLPEVFDIAATGYGLKFFLSTCMTPFLYILKGMMSTSFGLVPIPVETDPNEN